MGVENLERVAKISKLGHSKACLTERIDRVSSEGSEEALSGKQDVCEESGVSYFESRKYNFMTSRSLVGSGPGGAIFLRCASIL